MLKKSQAKKGVAIILDRKPIVNILPTIFGGKQIVSCVEGYAIGGKDMLLYSDIQMITGDTATVFREPRKIDGINFVELQVNERVYLFHWCMVYHNFSPI